ncbi:unnamed protein product [Onchocerca ochengi]|uniref:Uncharacterized protein n=1 Tax=Onchocerca ochengi TaxID=42157 RepID=A0A182DZR4_ONCOC|nr:unnamed protein product [Onchocerca ochengi]
MRPTIRLEGEEMTHRIPTPWLRKNVERSKTSKNSNDSFPPKSSTLQQYELFITFSFTLTQRLVHLTAPALLSQNGTLGAHIQSLCFIQANESSTVEDVPSHNSSSRSLYRI